jgi:hypothetical protein
MFFFEGDVVFVWYGLVGVVAIDCLMMMMVDTSTTHTLEPDCIHHTNKVNRRERAMRQGQMLEMM